MLELATNLASARGLDERIVWMLAALGLALLGGTLWRGGLLLRGGDAKLRQRLRSLATWWVLWLVLTAAILAGAWGVALLFAAASLAGFGEYRRLAESRVIDRRLWWWAGSSIPVHYALAYLGALGPFWTFIPVWVLGLLLVALVVSEETQGFLESAGIVFLGLMVLAYLLSHVVLLGSLAASAAPAAGPLGLVLYLVVLTESNDIAQALWGRRFGRRKITPRVSPHKTWEGFLLGAGTTIVLAALLAPLLTPLAECRLQLAGRGLQVPFLPAVLAGALVAVGGFFGDVTMSAIKREMNVKDSGTLLPGQGGVLDRIDSLTFTSPLFFYFVYLCCS